MNEPLNRNESVSKALSKMRFKDSQKSLKQYVTRILEEVWDDGHNYSAVEEEQEMAKLHRNLGAFNASMSAAGIRTSSESTTSVPPGFEGLMKDLL